MKSWAKALALATTLGALVLGRRRSRGRDDNLGIYLNDHLAGSVGALGLLERMLSRVEEAAVVDVLDRLRRQVEEDQAILEELMERVGVDRSPWRRLGATAGQKVSNLKLRLSPSKHGEVQLLHSLDILSAGIVGKKALWTALAAAAQDDPRLRSSPLGELLERADRQLTELVDLRPLVARRALGAASARSTGGR